MSETAVVHPSSVHPFHEPSRRRRLLKVGAWLVGIALAIVVLNLLGVDVIGWLQDLWDEIKDVPTRLHRRRGLPSRPARRSSPGSRTTASCARPTRARSSSGRS